LDWVNFLGLFYLCFSSEVGIVEVGLFAQISCNVIESDNRCFISLIMFPV
jgi:hypothetical protein